MHGFKIVPIQINKIMFKKHLVEFLTDNEVKSQTLYPVEGFEWRILFGKYIIIALLITLTWL